MVEGTSAADLADVPAVSELAGKNVWILGINFAPDKVGIAPYTTQMAEYFVARGANTAVTTGVPYYPGYVVDPDYRWKTQSREQINGVNVRRLRHTVPRKMTAARRGIHELSFLAHASLRRPPFRPDVIVGVTPALSGAVSAARHAKRLGVPLVVVFQDLVGPGTLQSGIQGGKRVSGLASRLEESVVREASDVIVLHRGFTQYVRDFEQPADRLHVIRNWSYALPAVTPRDEVRASMGWGSDQHVVLYGGNIGLKMGLENVIAAAELAEQRKLPLLFVILGDGNQRKQLEERSAGVSTIQFQDPRYGSGFPDALAAADTLLINERPSMDNMSLPSKLTYYFNSGNPVLAAVAPGGTTAQEIELAGAGVVVEPGRPEALLDAALELAKDPDRRRSMGEAGRRFAQSTYDKDAILGQYERVVASAISRG